MDHSHLYIVLAIIFGFFMAWGVGANDVANAMGTSVGSKAVTILQAIIIATIFEVLGSLLAGGQVTDTIRGGIINTRLFEQSPQLLVFGMLASLLAAGTWLIVATSFGWPVSTTHSIVGALIGFGLIVFGSRAIHWYQIINIVLSWVLTPMIAGTCAFLLFRSVQKLIFETDKPLLNAKRYVPWYIFLVALIVSSVTLLNGLKHIGLHLKTWHSVGIALVISIGMMLLGRLLLSRIPTLTDTDTHPDFKKLERVFGVLMIFTACSMAFAHGSNDVANAVGPLSAVVGIIRTGGTIMAKSAVPVWVMLVGAVGIALGLAMYGYKVIATVGSRITQLTPSRGFAAELATASTVVIASAIGLPISTTQTLVGAVLGVGLARGIGALNLGVVRHIFMSWVLTLPAGAVFSIIYYFILKAILPQSG